MTVENSVGRVTALNPHNGYTAATDIAKEVPCHRPRCGRTGTGEGPACRPAELMRPEIVAGSGAPAA